MDNKSQLSELAALLIERGIITTDVMPFCLLNPNHTGHALGAVVRGLVADDVAEAFQITAVDFYVERAASPTFEDAVAALMARHSSSGTGYLVRFFKPSPRGGFYTKVVFAHTLGEAMQKMLRA